MACTHTFEIAFRLPVTLEVPGDPDTLSEEQVVRLLHELREEAANLILNDEGMMAVRSGDGSPVIDLL